jgi:hypothetical protein
MFLKIVMLVTAELSVPVDACGVIDDLDMIASNSYFYKWLSSLKQAIWTQPNMTF